MESWRDGAVFKRCAWTGDSAQSVRPAVVEFGEFNLNLLQHIYWPYLTHVNIYFQNTIFLNKYKIKNFKFIPI